MEKGQLIDKLAYFLEEENGIGAVLYFVIQEGTEHVIRFADVENKAKEELKDRFLSFIREKFTNNEDLQLLNISEADERKNVIYQYDLKEKLQNLNILNEILNNEKQQKFNFNQDSLKNLQGYLITIGNEENKIALYKKHYPINLLQQDRFLLIPDNERLVKVPREAIALDKSFDFMMIDDQLIILKVDTLERHFGFEEVIRSQAKQVIDLIAKGELIDNINSIEELAKQLVNARKLMKVKNSPVINLPASKVIWFIKQHPDLGHRIHFNEEGTKIILDTTTSRKMFLKLLNDDYLFSNLTTVHYESLAKDRLT